MLGKRARCWTVALTHRCTAGPRRARCPDRLAHQPCFAPAPSNGTQFDYADWKIDHLNDLYESFASGQPSVTLLDYRPGVCPANQYAQTVDGLTIRSDDGIHDTNAGADLLARWLQSQLGI